LKPISIQSPFYINTLFSDVIPNNQYRARRDDVFNRRNDWHPEQDQQKSFTPLRRTMIANSSPFCWSLGRLLN
jgi:hypothetical protein